MAKSTLSLRALAQKLGLSHTTVSEALRGSHRVKPETRKKVMQAARESGYVRNPLAGALMSEIRRSRAGTFRGVIAVLDLDGSHGRAPEATRFHTELLKGVKSRAVELGFKVESFALGKDGLTPTRIEGIMHARGIRGIYILPVKNNPDCSWLDWTHFAGIYSDYIIESPPLHTVCSDHYRSMMAILPRMHARGYRRPGLILSELVDARLLYRWEAAFNIYARHHTDMMFAPILTSPEMTEAEFRQWFLRHKPDFVMSHRTDVLEWMRRAGAKVPDQHGFCCLNLSTTDEKCAGLDLQPKILGERGVELLIGQLLRNEYGVPEIPSTTTVPALWVDGPTLRPSIPGEDQSLFAKAIASCEKPKERVLSSV